MSVSSKYLLEGCFYALEQCGLLLGSASLLFDHGDFATSVVLAAFAREELGRSRILLDFLNKVLSGESFSLEEIETICRNHVRKQESAQVSRVTRGGPGDRVTELIKIMHLNKLDGPEADRFKVAWEELKAIADERAQAIPKERHLTRMKALYVEPTEDGTSWSRPCDQFDSSESDFFLLDAINDYSSTVGRITRDVIEVKEGPMSDLIKTWPQRPVMPPLPWPKTQFPQGEVGRSTTNKEKE